MAAVSGCKHLTVNPDRHKELKTLAISENKILHGIVDEVLELGIGVYVRNMVDAKRDAEKSQGVE